MILGAYDIYIYIYGWTGRFGEKKRVLDEYFLFLSKRYLALFPIV